LLATKIKLHSRISADKQSIKDTQSTIMSKVLSNICCIFGKKKKTQHTHLSPFNKRCEENAFGFIFKKEAKA
jgi:hypothetical protein